MATEMITVHVDHKNRGAADATEVRSALMQLIWTEGYWPTESEITRAEDGAWEVPVPTEYVDSVREHGYPVELGDDVGNFVHQTDADVARVIEGMG